MNGINILETIELVKYPYTIISLIGIFATMFMYAFYLYRISDNNNMITTDKHFYISVIFFTILIGIWFIPVLYQKPTGEYEYICTVDNNVTMGELTEYYEILDAYVNKDNIVEFRVKEK